MNELVLRAKMQHYMKVGSPLAFKLVGDGFTAFAESKNAKEYSRQYVHQSTEITDVIGFAPSMAYTAELYTEDPVCQHVAMVTDNELVGADARVEVVEVHLWESAGANTYKAYKRAYAIVPDGKGDGVEALVYTGNMKAVDEITVGTFNTVSNTFNATAATVLTFTCTAGVAAGHTDLGTIAPALTAGDSYVVLVSAQAVTLPNQGDVVDHTYAEWDGSDEVAASAGDTVYLVEIDAESKCVAAGSSAAVVS